MQASLGPIRRQEPEILGEITDSSTVTGKIQDDPKTACVPGSKDVLKKSWEHVARTQDPILKGLPGKKLKQFEPKNK